MKQSSGNFNKKNKSGQRFSPRPAPRRAAPKPDSRFGGNPDRAFPRRHPDNLSAEGVYSGAKSGYGFVDVEGLEQDIFIPAGRNGGALDGDRVSVRYHAYMSGETRRTEGEVAQILELGRTTVIGTLCEESFVGHGKKNARYFVVPDDTHLSMELTVADPLGARVGDKVELALPARNPERGEIICTVNRVFGPATSREANYAAILAECGITVDFTEEELAQATEVAAIPLTGEKRTDRTGEIIFTIDGAGAKDLDDAVALVRLPNGNWQLGVHIADVSHYVTPKTPLDAASLSRGTSVYFTDKVVPMLPTALSNGACSLNAGEDKYALSAMMELTPDGTFVRTVIGRSLIRSTVRGVYSEVNDLFEKGTDSDFYEKYRAVYPTLTDMHALYAVLAEKSKRRGALDLEQTEAEIILDEHGMPVDIQPRVRGDAEKMIEQFMLAANECVATELHKKDLPCVYRIHENPSPEKLAEFAVFAHNLGFDADFITKKDPTGCDFSALLDAAKERELGTAISYTLLRTMAKAHYSEICHPHFGLGIDYYCHFTSPIRRLSDLATHRMIEAVLLDGEAKAKYMGYARRAAAAASETELKAMSAERKIDALYKTLYLSRRIGETYPALVSSVTRFGIFAALENTCEGLIPLTELPGGMWTFDEGNLSLRSSDGTLLHLGDKIEVCVEEADVSRGKVRFSLVSRTDGNGEKQLFPKADATAVPARVPTRTSDRATHTGARRPATTDRGGKTAPRDNKNAPRGGDRSGTRTAAPTDRTHTAGGAGSKPYAKKGGDTRGGKGNFRGGNNGR